MTFGEAGLAGAISISLVLGAPLEGQELRSEFVDVGGYRLHFVVADGATEGSSRPTILLESGAGEDVTFWEAIQPRLAEEFGTTVVTYDRAGFGQSDLPETSYDIRQEVVELRRGLATLGLEEEVLLVAHSYGALHAQLYADEYPEAVAGIVFLDPNTPAAFVAPLGELWPPEPILEPETKEDRGFARTDSTMFEAMAEVFLAPLSVEIPIVVISAEEAWLEDERQAEAWVLGHQLLAKSVREGEWWLAEGAGHRVVDRRPDLLFDAVRRLLTYRDARMDSRENDGI